MNQKNTVLYDDKRCRSCDKYRLPIGVLSNWLSPFQPGAQIKKFGLFRKSVLLIFQGHNGVIKGDVNWQEKKKACSNNISKSLEYDNEIKHEQMVQDATRKHYYMPDKVMQFHQYAVSELIAKLVKRNNIYITDYFKCALDKKSYINCHGHCSKYLEKQLDNRNIQKIVIFGKEQMLYFISDFWNNFTISQTFSKKIILKQNKIQVGSSLLLNNVNKVIGFYKGKIPVIYATFPSRQNADRWAVNIKELEKAIKI